MFGSKAKLLPAKITNKNRAIFVCREKYEQLDEPRVRMIVSSIVGFMFILYYII